MDRVKKHFNEVSKSYDSGKEKYSYYYSNIKSLLASIIPKNKKVIEIGCGTGDLLESLNPTLGVGFDLSPEMIKIAKNKHRTNKNLLFTHHSPFTIHHSPDYIFMTDVIEHMTDPQTEFNKIASLMDKKTIFVNTMANPIWEPLLMIWEKIGWKMPEGPHYRIKYDVIYKMLKKSNMKVVKHDYKLLFPIQIPIVTKVVNTYLEKYLKKYAFIEYFIAKKK